MICNNLNKKHGVGNNLHGNLKIHIYFALGINFDKHLFSHKNTTKLWAYFFVFKKYPSNYERFY